MKIKKKTSEDYEINIIEFVKTLWEKKFYVFIITLSFTVAFYTYSANEDKLYQTKIITNQSPSYQLNFKNNFFFLEKEVSNDYYNFFTISFNQKIISSDHLIKFAKQYDQLDEFTSYLKTKNITIENYFNGKFRKIFEKKK
jgi:LPS O-antigen subunit length determinant protein (WzzB/FepE family)